MVTPTLLKHTIQRFRKSVFKPFSGILRNFSKKKKVVKKPPFLVEVTFLSGLNADLIAIDCGFDSDFLFSGDLKVVCFHILVGNRKVLVFELFKDRAINIQRDVYVRVS